MAKQILTDLDLAGNKVTGIAPGTTTGDAVAYEQLGALGGGTLTDVVPGVGTAVNKTTAPGSASTPEVSVLLDPTGDVALTVTAAGLKLDGSALGMTDAEVDAKVDDITITTVPSTSLSTVKSGSSATGDLTYTITLDSLTLANTITTPQQADPNTPLVAGEPGDVYIDTTGGTAWINDGTGWVQLDPAVVTGVTTIVAGAGIAVDMATPAAPVVSAVIDPASDPALTVSAAGISLTIPPPVADPTVAHTFTADVPLTAATAATVTHNLNKARVLVQVYDGANLVEVDVAIVDANSLTLTASVPFTAGVIVVG
jgi:hypothetical protein